MCVCDLAVAGGVCLKVEQDELRDERTGERCDCALSSTLCVCVCVCLAASAI